MLEAAQAGRPQRPAYLTRILGEPPQQEAAGQLWNAAAEAIESYRGRWGIADTASALGPQPDDAPQRADREATATELRELTQRLRDLQAEPDHGRSRQATAKQVGLGHGPFRLDPASDRP